MKVLQDILFKPKSIAPLAIFRVIFGFMMLASISRFAWYGWIEELYVTPKFFFSYYGFDWVQPLGFAGTYVLFAGVGIAALLMMLGLFYRPAAILFFIGFTYIELMDKTNYLNHYYFVSLISFILIFLPAGRYFSLDAKLKLTKVQTAVPAWTIYILLFQLSCVYFFAGIAKLHPDWLIEALPLKMWLPAKSDNFPLGHLLEEDWVAYVFSWFGCIYDLTLPFFLLMTKTRKWAYAAVVAFHVLTWLLFPIGMFPFIMIGSTLLFFPSTFHERIIAFFSRKDAKTAAHTFKSSARTKRLVLGSLTLYATIQLFLPFRYLLYPDNLFWTEEGYRFSWRVMLMEKAGKAFFYVKDPALPGRKEIVNSEYLTPQQERMMATQPDMILQYAHFLAAQYQNQGIVEPEIRAEIWVTLNGRGSRLFIDKDCDLSKERESFAHKEWILPYIPEDEE